MFINNVSITTYIAWVPYLSESAWKRLESVFNISIFCQQ